MIGLLKRVVIGSLLLLSVSTFGQIDSTKGRTIKNNKGTRQYYAVAPIYQAELAYQYNSTALDNAFFQSVFLGEFIDDELKTRQLDRLKSSNRMGFNVSQRIQGGNTKWSASLTNNELLNMKFSDDAFRLLFFGNKATAGTPQNLGQLNYTYMNYQKIGFMVHEVLEKDYQLSLGGGIYKISRLQRARINSATLLTAEDGTSITYYGDLDLVYSPVASRVGGWSGTGIAVDAQLDKIFYDKSWYRIQVRDLGLGFMGELERIQSNGSSTFTGIQLPEIAFITGEEFQEFRLDSIALNQGFTYEKKGYTYVLPAMLDAHYAKKISTGFVHAGLRYYLNSNYIPRVTAGYEYKSRGFSVMPEVAVGGYGKVDIDLSVSYKFDKRFYLGGRFTFIESLISPKSTSGQGIVLTASGYL